MYMVDQVGRLREILAEIANPGRPIDIVFVDWAPDTDGMAATPLRDFVDTPIVSSVGALIGHGGFFEVVCNDMIAGIFALNPLDSETRHIDSYAMQTYYDDGTFSVVDLEDAEQYGQVKVFLEQMVVR